jgi:hypothetical protein
MSSPRSSVSAATKKAGKPSLVSITQGEGFVHFDAQVQAERQRWHKLLDRALDEGDTLMLNCLSAHFNAFEEMLDEGVCVRGGDQ